MSMRVLVVALLLFLLASCVLPRDPVVPMPVLTLKDLGDTNQPDDRLLVLLPGIRDTPEDFAENGFADVVDEPMAIVAADAHLGYYRDESLEARLTNDVLGQRADSETQILLAGTSLGGMGALLYLCDSGDTRISHIFLIAPYLGEDEILEQVAASGDLASWQADPAIGELHERKLWTCLARTQWGTGSAPELWLAYGADDRLAEAHALLAKNMPDDRVTVQPGGHNWRTWSNLWQELWTRQQAH